MRHTLFRGVAAVLFTPTLLWAQIAASAAVDSIAAKALATGEVAGLTVVVARGANTLLHKGYGRADVELDVATPRDAVYEIGSVTKQFTAAAILQLAEQGKLSLDDEITRYLPLYSTQGNRVTLRRLLDHTSGVKGYTEMAEFSRLSVQSLPRDTLVALFASKPFDFRPGEAMRYNNSAYFLLGLVIERVSGLSYEKYLQQYVFARAGMQASRYCSNSAVVPNRAHGYEVDAGQLRRAPYLDHTWPYAAGSICSTAGDLLAWTNALHGGRILGPVAYREMLTPGLLQDGTRLRYAAGIAVGDSLAGHAAIYHDGAIPGFSSALAYLPDDSVIIVVLMNTLGPVNALGVTKSIVRALLGDLSPRGKPFRGDAADYTGRFRGVGRSGDDMTLIVTGDSAAGLRLGVGTEPALPLTWLGGQTFGLGATRYTFVREQNIVNTVRVDDVFSDWVFARKSVVAEAAAEPLKDLRPTAEERQRFVGLYAVTDGKGGKPSAFRVYDEGGSLMGQMRTNDPTRLMYQGGNLFRPEASPEFRIAFMVENGRATKVTIVSPDVTMNGDRNDVRR